MPPPWHPRTPVRLRRGVVALACLPLVALAVRLDGPPVTKVASAEPAAASAVSTPTTVAGPRVAPPTTSTTEPAPIAPTAPAATDVVPPTTSATSPDPIEPGPLQPASSGQYPVRVVDDHSSQTGTLTIDGAGRQMTSVGGVATARVVRSRPDGDVLVASHETDEPDCTWSPAPLVIPSDAGEGRSWTSSASCTTSSDGEWSVARDEDASITSRVRTAFGGRSVDCWLVRRHVVMTMRSSSVTITTESVRSELFAPSLGLAVYAIEKMDLPSADGSVHSALWSTEVLGLPSG